MSRASYELGLENGRDLVEWAEMEHPEFTRDDVVDFIRGVLEAATACLNGLQKVS
jgi:hypothetical protein